MCKTSNPNRRITENVLQHVISFSKLWLLTTMKADITKIIHKSVLVNSKCPMFVLQSNNFCLTVFSLDDSTDCWEDARVPSLSRPDGKFGDYNCDSSYELISSVLQFMKAKMGDNIDFILWTGYV